MPNLLVINMSNLLLILLLKYKLIFFYCFLVILYNSFNIKKDIKMLTFDFSFIEKVTDLTLERVIEALANKKNLKFFSYC